MLLYVHIEKTHHCEGCSWKAFSGWSLARAEKGGMVIGVAEWGGSMFGTEDYSDENVCMKGRKVNGDRR